MRKKGKYVSMFLSYILTVCLIVGVFTTTTFAKDSVQMTEVTKPQSKKTVQMTEATKPQTQKTMQVTDVQTQKTEEVEIEKPKEEKPKEEKKEEKPPETQTMLTQQPTTINETGEPMPLDGTATQHDKVCNGNHEGWTKINSYNNHILKDGMYYLDNDFVLSSGGLSIAGDVTLCLNGYRLETKSAYRVIQLDSSSDRLTLFDNADNKGTIIGGSDVGIDIVCGKFIMNGGTITGNGGETYWGGGVYAHQGDSMSPEGEFIMNGGKIARNKTSYGGGVCVSGKFTMNDGTINFNTAASGGGVYVGKNGKFTMNGGTITGNEALKGGGGGVCATNFSMEGGSITDNVASYGGGVYASNFTMKNGKITQNKALINAGGVYIPSDDTAQFNVSDTPIITENFIAEDVESTEGVTSNVYLFEDKIITAGTLNKNAEIGITVEDLPTSENPKRKIAESTDDISSGFISDNPKYETTFSRGNVYLGKGDSSTPSEFTVKFNSKGGTAISNKIVEEGKTVEKPADPTRKNYTFVGWFTDEDCTQKYDFNEPVTQSFTLYAKWNDGNTPTPPEGSDEFTVTFDNQDGSDVTEQTVKYGETVTKPADPTRTGYTFDGWYKEQECNNAWNFATDTVTKNITLYAKWTKETTVDPTPPAEVKYTITFNSQGGSDVPSKTIKQNEKVDKPNDPTRIGYTFDGWFTDVACTNPYDFDTLVTGSFTLYAKWNDGNTPTPPEGSDEFTVTFDSQGGSTVSGQTIKQNGKVTKPEDPTKDGYTFLGWFKDKNCIQAWDFNVDVVKSNITLYAKWNNGNTPTPPEDTDEFTVTFNSNGGSIVSSQTVENGQKVTKPADPTRTGYTFDGWYKEQECNNAWNFSTDTVTANITLYAKWEENKTTPPNPTLPTTKYYTVTFESNGGSKIPSQTIETGKTAVMPENPTKSDCEFLGWFADKNFNEVYRFSTPVTKDITIYAKWKSDDCIVTFETNGGSEISSQIIETGKTAVMPENPIKSGYEFLGWFADENFNEVYRFSTPITEDITIYAKWKSKSHSSGGSSSSGSSSSGSSSSGSSSGGSSSGGSSSGGSSSSGRTGSWVTEEPKTTQTTIQPLIQPTTQYPAIKQDCPRDETCPLWKFIDVDRWAWYHDGSHYCVEKDLIVGTKNTTFSPDMPITRAMVVTILWRIENKPLVNDVITFQDIKETAYYAEAVRWAAYNGIVSGYSNTVFAPDDSITREQMASILYRYTQYKNKDVSGRADISNYQDRNEISNYALIAIQWACDTGVINGISTEILSPKGTTTRAQAAQMFKAYLEEQL